MILIIAGMPRSGSTYSFNIARECLLATGTVQAAASDALPPAAQLSGTDHFILKSHHPEPEVLAMMASGRAQAICTYRKPEDAVASAAAVFALPVADALRSVRDWLQWHRNQHWPCAIDYERIERDPVALVGDIAAYLHCQLDATTVERLTKRYDKCATFERVSHMQPSDSTVDTGMSYYDRQSLFHRGHVRSLRALAAADTLGDADLQLVRQTLAPFVDAKGNYVPL